MKIICCFTLILISTTGFSKSTLWGNLEKNHNVGFISLSTYDYSRSAIFDQDMTGKVRGTADLSPGRQMRISVWYPSASDGKKMTYADYLNELANEIDFTEVTDLKRSQVLDKVVALYRDYQRNDTFSKENLMKLMRIEMESVRNAKPQKGKFPLLIFPHWFSPMDGAIMSEYVASQGFVVATTSMKGTDSVSPEITARGLEAISADINFIINQLSSLSYVDVTRVAVMGVGFNATGALAAMKDASSIDAFVSLDGGIITISEMQMFQQRGDVNLLSLAKPMLFINAPHPSVKPELADFFKYSDRHYITYSKMSEYYFLNNGMLESIVPGIIGTPPGDVKAGFQSAARNVSNFLKYALKEDPTAKGALEAPESEDVKKSFKKGAPKPPDLHQWKVICATEGAKGLREVYKTFSATDNHPMTQAVFADLFSWLAFGRDDGLTIRNTLLELWTETYPKSSRAAFAQARLLTSQNKKNQAEEFYRKALLLLPDDDDIYFDNTIRMRIQVAANEALRN